MKQSHKQLSDFSSHKNGGVSTLGGAVVEKKGLSLIFILTFSSVTFLRVCGVCVFCLFTPYLSLLFVFQKKNLAL